MIFLEGSSDERGLRLSGKTRKKPQKCCTTVCTVFSNVQVLLQSIPRYLGMLPHCCPAVRHTALKQVRLVSSIFYNIYLCTVQQYCTAAHYYCSWLWKMHFCCSWCIQKPNCSRSEIMHPNILYLSLRSILSQTEKQKLPHFVDYSSSVCGISFLSLKNTIFFLIVCVLFILNLRNILSV